MRKLLLLALAAALFPRIAGAVVVQYFDSNGHVHSVVSGGASPNPLPISCPDGTTNCFGGGGGGDATAANQATQITAANTTNTDLGPPGATACATDTGSCSLNALMQRINQRLTTLNTTLGTPFQAGGSIGNSSFAATQSGTWSLRLQDGTGNAITSDIRGSERPLSVQVLDASGNQVTAFGGTGGTNSSFTSSFPASGTAVGFNDGSNMQGARVFDLDTGGGTQYVLGVGLRLSGSGGSVEAGTSSNPIRVDPTGTTSQPVQIQTATSGGTSTKSLQVANNTTSVAVDASPGQIYGIRAFNNSATIAYGKLYDASQGSTTCGSGTPKNRFMIPANTSGAGFVVPIPYGITYSTAITICVTTGFADNDSGAPAATTYIVEIDYK